MLNLEGISDALDATLVSELKLEQRQSDEKKREHHADNINNRSRALLTSFSSSHPQAERALSRLILKHLGISRAVLRDQHSLSSSVHCSTHGIDNGCGGGVADLIPRDETPCEGKDCLHPDVIPALCPIPWLSQMVWDSISNEEKVELMELAILGLSHPAATARHRIYPSTSKFSDSFVMFGRGCVDRVVIGSGPRHMLILVGVHGNEPCGVQAARLILQKHHLFRPTRPAESSSPLATRQEMEDDANWTFPLSDLFGEMTIEFIVGNPRAVQANRRFLTRNLNRLLDVHVLCDEKAVENGDGYEIQRARIVYEAIRHSDSVLDIHSVSSDSDPFAIPASTEASEELAQQLPVSYVVESLAHLTAEGGTSMDAALIHNVPAVCVECGQHNHEDIVARAADVISTFLMTQYEGEKAGVGGRKADKESRPVVMRCEGIEVVQEGFEWCQSFKEFEWIPHGMPVFKDGIRGEVKCPIEPGSYLVMPTKIPVVGEEALCWARDVGGETETVPSEEPQ